jgi:hypothetical protein
VLNWLCLHNRFIKNLLNLALAKFLQKPENQVRCTSDQGWYQQQSCSNDFSDVDLEGFRMGQTTTTSLFRTIPPERVGVSGDYDHYGLAKRVMLAFNQAFETSEIAKLRITQRGSVVVVMGTVDSQRLLIRLVQVAMGVSGAADVEINGVSVADCLKAYLDKPSKAVLANLLNLVTKT